MDCHNFDDHSNLGFFTVIDNFDRRSESNCTSNFFDKGEGLKTLRLT